MASTSTEEVEALEAIYCGHEEFPLHQLGNSYNFTTEYNIYWNYVGDNRCSCRAGLFSW